LLFAPYSLMLNSTRRVFHQPMSDYFHFHDRELIAINPVWSDRGRSRPVDLREVKVALPPVGKKSP
jgi:hypothetical protein